MQLNGWPAAGGALEPRAEAIMHTETARLCVEVAHGPTGPLPTFVAFPSSAVAPRQVLLLLCCVAAVRCLKKVYKLSDLTFLVTAFDANAAGLPATCVDCFANVDRRP